MALTASANNDIQIEIASSLHLVDPVVVAHSLDRPNIFFSVGEIKSVNVSIHVHTPLPGSTYHYTITIQKDLAGLTSLLSSTTSEIPKTLIFTQTKKSACKLFCLLTNSSSKRGAVGMYHASLTSETKLYCQRDFAKDGSIRCLVATVAFGMVSV